MSSPYRGLHSEGQFDPYACWAASLCWWLRAVKDGRPQLTQSDLLVKFDTVTDDNGALQVNKFLDIIPAYDAFKISAAIFKSADYKYRGLPLGDLPVLIAYQHPQAGIHMNVLFNQIGRQVTAMEPFFPYPGADGKRTGQYIDRSVDFFIGSNTEIMLAWPTVDFSSVVNAVKKFI